MCLKHIEREQQQLVFLTIGWSSFSCEEICIVVFLKWISCSKGHLNSSYSACRKPQLETWIPPCPPDTSWIISCYLSKNIIAVLSTGSPLKGICAFAYFFPKWGNETIKGVGLRMVSHGYFDIWGEIYYTHTHTVLVSLCYHRTCSISYANSLRCERKVRKSLEENQGHLADNTNCQ